MATLSIKNVPDSLCRKLRARAKREHRSVAQEVIHILRRAIEEQERVSILELRGLGKKLWAGINPPEYIEHERRSWERPWA
ncbi:MAG: plasmid stabilization protein [Candidatus Rokubacteria bacterium]|nr:plasmid stabilization protein [Candidatus Rokubacteria bacterium]